MYPRKKSTKQNIVYFTENISFLINEKIVYINRTNVVAIHGGHVYDNRGDLNCLLEL